MKRMEQGTKVNCGHTCLAMMVDDHDLTQVNAVLGHDGSNPDDQGNPLGLTEAEAVLFLYRRGCLPLWVKGKLSYKRTQRHRGAA